jgi:putative endonuclease
MESGPALLSSAPAAPEEGAAWTVYIIESARGTLYTGITTEPSRRFREHASGKGARWFRGTAPRRFVYLEACADRSAALRREAAIKRLKRAEKWALAAASGPLPEGCP